MKSAIIEAAEALEAITNHLGSHPVMSRDDYSYLCDLAQRLRAEAEALAWVEAQPDADEKAMEAILIAARKSYIRHRAGVRGQQMSRADSFESHVVWATMAWCGENTAIQEGWKLVPVEPTEAMQIAGGSSCAVATTAANKLWTANKIYRAMLSAAPAPPAVNESLTTGWVRTTDRLPKMGEGIRVLIYTEGHDFGGEQYFDVLADDLNECAFPDPEQQPEVCRHATHWMPLPSPPASEVGS